MDFNTAETKAKAFAKQGDVKGLQAYLTALRESGMNPAFLMLLGQYVEAAMLNLGRKTK